MNDYLQAEAIPFAGAARWLALRRNDGREPFENLYQTAGVEIYIAVTTGRLASYMENEEGRLLQVYPTQFTRKYSPESLGWENGTLVFLERDLEDVFGSAASSESSAPNVPAKKTLPASRNKALREFLNKPGFSNENEAWRAAEAHFGTKIPRNLIRDLRILKGKRGRPKIPPK